MIWDRFLSWDVKRESRTMATGESTTFTITPPAGEAFLLEGVDVVVSDGTFDLTLYHHPEINVESVPVDSSLLFDLTIPSRPILTPDSGLVVKLNCTSAGTIHILYTVQRGIKKEVEMVKELMEKEKQLKKRAWELIQESHLFEVFAPTPPVEIPPAVVEKEEERRLSLLPLLLLGMVME